MGVFLRKAFSSVNAVHITPGAFSIYRKEFFDKYGGFHEHTLTEDMEMALRIQFNHFVIANNPDAVVYTIAPNKFIPLMKQRRRCMQE
jgi:cellulose synthase/poly-beta-1,6-N-acetylglucosamine synthase-like glycosyltransferase